MALDSALWKFHLFHYLFWLHKDSMVENVLLEGQPAIISPALRVFWIAELSGLRSGKPQEK
jgi:hypothetical protein